MVGFNEGFLPGLVMAIFVTLSALELSPMSTETERMTVLLNVVSVV